MDGIIIINKPKDCTSHDIVYKVKKILGEKVGHIGTLDPMATGVLPLLIGKATLCSKYLINHDKMYKVLMQLGKKTDTADGEGKIIKEQQVQEEIFNEQKILKTLEGFKGKQTQIPPIYSAIKVKGKKLYEYARKGESIENIEIKPRNIKIYDIELLNVDKINQQIQFKVKCSKGTYIRSLCEDIATKLNTIAYMKELERLQVGEFKIEESTSIEMLEKNKNEKEWIEKNIITIEELFKDKQTINLTDKQLYLFLNGVKLTQQLENEIYKVYNNEKFIGIGTISNNLLKRDIVL